MHAPLFKTALVCTNLAILSFLTILIVEHVKANHNILSWSSAFHILCMCWLTMRGIFWFFTISSDGSWSNVTFYTLYWMPHPFQFGAFMLLPLFFAQVVYPTVWQNYWAYVRPVYVLSLFGIVAFQTVWAVLATIEDQRMSDTCDDPTDGSKSAAGANATAPPPATSSTAAAAAAHSDSFSSECFHTDYSSDAFRVIASFLFVGLAITQGMYGYQIALLDERQYGRFFNAPRQVLNVVNLTLFVSFLSRGLYQIGAVFGLSLMPQIPLQGDEDVSPAVFLSFMLWEYVPTILLVLSVTSRTLGSQRSHGAKLMGGQAGALGSGAGGGIGGSGGSGGGAGGGGGGGGLGLGLGLALGGEGQRLLSLNTIYGSYGLFGSFSPAGQGQAQREAEMALLLHSARGPVDHTTLERCVCALACLRAFLCSFVCLFVGVGVVVVWVGLFLVLVLVWPGRAGGRAGGGQ